MTTPDAKPLRIGDVINGFAAGVFGRDFWGPARVEFIGGDWIVVRGSGTNAGPWFGLLDSQTERELTTARDTPADDDREDW